MDDEAASVILDDGSTRFADQRAIALADLAAITPNIVEPTRIGRRQEAGADARTDTAQIAAIIVAGGVPARAIVAPPVVVAETRPAAVRTRAIRTLVIARRDVAIARAAIGAGRDLAGSAVLKRRVGGTLTPLIGLRVARRPALPLVLPLILTLLAILLALLLTLLLTLLAVLLTLLLRRDTVLRRRPLAGTRCTRRALLGRRPALGPRGLLTLGPRSLFALGPRGLPAALLLRRSPAAVLRPFHPLLGAALFALPRTLVAWPFALALHLVGRLRRSRPGRAEGGQHGAGEEQVHQCETRTTHDMAPTAPTGAGGRFFSTDATES